MSLNPHFGNICSLLSQGNTYEDISQYLKTSGFNKGSSVANIRKFCRENGIHQRREYINDTVLDRSVMCAVYKVGPTYGRRMMTGYLRSKGIRAAEQRVSQSLKKHDPTYHSERHQRLRNLNVLPYFAAYHGHKLHMDQNEKLAMFGVTHVLAVDGYSSCIVGYATMPVKNNLTIYEEVFRPAVLHHGMWDTVRVDHGTEFYLTLYMQEKNSLKRFNQERSPYLQSQSKQNLRVERLWPEVNNRVTYPLKTALVEMVDQEILDMDDSTSRFCASNLTIEVARIGMKRFVDSWNSHRINGIPNELKEHKFSGEVCEEDFPPTTVAARLYEENLDGKLTIPKPFAPCPLTVETHKRCEVEFAQHVPDLGDLLDAALNRNPKPFQLALQKLIEIYRNVNCQ